jgi:flagellar hook-associated protein 2
MSTSITSSINLSSLGLGDGLDDSSLISQLVAIESAPLTTLQSQASSIASASSSISSFSSALNSLKAAAQTLADPTQYNSFSANSSAPSVVASTTTGAVAGSYNVTVSALAQAQTTFSDPQSSSASPLGISGILGLTVGGSTVNVAIASGDSLADVAAAISSSGAPVSASVVYDGSQYRLDVQGTQTGSAGAITFDEAGFSLGLSKPVNTYQAAQDAEASIDGINVSSPTNQVSGAIPGVTLALTGTTPAGSPATVSVSASDSSLATNIQTFISAYNSVVTAGHSDAGYGTASASNSLLAADDGIETSLTQLGDLVSSTVAGAGSTFNTLGSVGISINDDGTLSLNSSTLQQAVQSDPAGVEKLFVTAPGQGMTGVMGTISTTIDNLANNSGSVLQGETQMYLSRTTEMNTQETAMQARIAQYQTLLQSEFSTADETVNTDRTLFSDVGGTGTFM